jgi:CheY-like chemotaxis protein
MIMSWSANSLAEAESWRPRCKSSVLIVDDDADSREMLTLVMMMAGHTVRTARDGEEALEVAEAFRPDVIFLDIQMPKANGYVACQNMRKSSALQKARIYAVSARTGAVHEARCSAAGFDGQVSKPADPDGLVRLARSLP